MLGSLVGPRSLGRHIRPLLAEADVVLLVGTRTNQNGTDSWRLVPPDARVIHIDIDPQEIGRNYEALRLVGDAAATLDALAAALRARDLAKRLAARDALERRIAQAWERFAAERRAPAGANTAPIRPERVMADLQRLLTPAMRSRRRRCGGCARAGPRPASGPSATSAAWSPASAPTS